MNCSVGISTLFLGKLHKPCAKTVLNIAIIIRDIMIVSVVSKL